MIICKSDWHMHNAKHKLSNWNRQKTTPQLVIWNHPKKKGGFILVYDNLWTNNKVQQKLTHQRFQYNTFQHTTTTQFGATHTHTLMTVSHHCTLFYCLNSYINPFFRRIKTLVLPKLPQTPPWMGSAQRHAPNSQCSDESRPREKGEFF